MKNKSVLFVSLFLILLLSSCEEKEINCSDPDGREVLYGLLSQEFDVDYHSPYPNVGAFHFTLPYQDVINDFFKESVSMIGIRPTELNKDLQKCSCEASLEVRFPDDLVDFLKKNNDYDFNFDEIEKTVTFNNVDYSYQRTEDSRIYCESTFDENLKERFLLYALLKNYRYNIEKGIADTPEPESGDVFPGLLKYVDFQFGDNAHYLFEDEQGNIVDFLWIEDHKYDLLIDDDVRETINPEFQNKKFRIQYRVEKLYPYDGAEELMDFFVITGIEMQE